MVFGVQSLLDGIFGVHTFYADQLPDAIKVNNSVSLNERKARRLLTMPDGKFVVAGGTEGELSVVNTDAQSNETIDENIHAEMKSNIKAIGSLGGDLFVTGDNNALIATWDAKKCEPRATVELYNNSVTAVAALSENAFIVGTVSGKLGCFEHRCGRGLQEFGVIFRAHKTEVTAIIANDQVVLTTSLDGTAKLWDSKTMVLIAALKHEHGVVHIDMDSQNIVTGTIDGEIRVFRNDDKHTLEKIFRGLHEKTGVTFVKLLGNDTLLSAGMDGIVAFTDMSEKKCIVRVNTNIAIRSVAILGDGRIAICGVDGTESRIIKAPKEVSSVMSKHADRMFSRNK